MRLCSKCRFYSREYDEGRQEWDDVVKIGDDTELHHCPMYEDHIPKEIYDGDADCVFYEPKEAT
jgi:hypothetical protein